MRILDLIKDHHKKNRSKMAKQFSKYLNINICIIILSTGFLCFTTNGSIPFFVENVMLFNTGLAWSMLGRPKDENNEHNQIDEKNDDT